MKVLTNRKHSIYYQTVWPGGGAPGELFGAQICSTAPFPREGKIANEKLPVVLTNPISHDRGVVAELSGFPEFKIGKRNGFKLPDEDEEGLVQLVKTGYFRCLKAGNQTPTTEHIVATHPKGHAREVIGDTIGKGNSYDKLLVPVLDGRQSPYWNTIVELLKRPGDFGFPGLPSLREDVKIEPTGKKAPELPAV